MANYNHNRKLFQSAMQEVHQRDEKIQSLYGELKENTNINNPQLLNEIIGSLLLGAAVAAPVVAAGYNIYKKGKEKKEEQRQAQEKLNLERQRHADEIAARQAEIAARTAASQAQTAESQADREARIKQAEEDRAAKTAASQAQTAESQADRAAKIKQAQAERKSREKIAKKRAQGSAKSSREKLIAGMVAKGVDPKAITTAMSILDAMNKNKKKKPKKKTPLKTGGGPASGSPTP